MSRYFRFLHFASVALMVFGALTFASSPAFAEPAGGDHGGDHAAAGDHGDAHADEHGGGHHGAAFTGDNDGDGTANWMDADDEHYVLSGIGFHLINFLLYGALMVFMARQPVADMLRGRALGIKQELAEASRLKDEADARFAEVQQRLSNFEAELDGMMAQATADAEAERVAIVARGEAEAVRIRQSTAQQIRDEAARAKAGIRSEAVAMAVQLAEGLLTSAVTPTDQRKLASEFLVTIQEDGHV